MQEKPNHTHEKILTKKLATRLVVIVVPLLLVIAILATFFGQPERSVASYCKVYKEQNAKLANATGSTYAVAVFSHRSSKPSDFISAFSALEKVSPDEIQSDVKTLKQIFQTIESSPAQAATAELSGIGAESSVKSWTDTNCGG